MYIWQVCSHWLLLRSIPLKIWLFHSRKLQINLTYSTSGMLFEKNFNRIRTVSVSIKVDIFFTLNFNHFCSEAVTARIPDPTKSWRTVSDGCPTILSLAQFSPHLLCPNLNCSFFLICFCASFSFVLLWLLLWLLIHVTNQTLMTADKLQSPVTSEVLLRGGNKRCWQQGLRWEWFSVMESGFW